MSEIVSHFAQYGKRKLVIIMIMYLYDHTIQYVTLKHVFEWRVTEGLWNLNLFISMNILQEDPF